MNQNTKLVPLLGKPLKVINVGLDLFHQTLKLQRVKVLQVDWQPPADGDQRLTKLLDKLLE